MAEEKRQGETGMMDQKTKDPMSQNRPILSSPIILGDLNLGTPTTQTTIGAGGAASAIPTPVGYLLVQIGNATYAIPFCNP